MPYRDDLELRRAHVRRLERELAELDTDLAEVARLTREGSWWERLLGGPRGVARRFELEGELGDEALVACCERVFRVGGDAVRDGARWTWRGLPDPRPRQVEVVATRERGRTRVTVRDWVPGRASYGAYALLGSFAGLVPQLFRSSTTLLPIGVGAAWIATLVAVRAHVMRRARRRALDAQRLVRALEAEAVSGTSTAVRVSREPDDAAEVEEPETERRAPATAEVA